MAIGLFGRRMTRQAPPPMEPAKPMDQYDPLGQGLQRPQGLFGRLGNRLRNVDWEAVGAAMRDDPSILQNLQGQRNERRLLDFRVRGAKLEDLQAQQEAERERELADREYKQDSIENDYRNRALGQEQEYRRAQLELTRRGQDLDYAASQNRLASTPMQLRGADRNLMTRTQETAEGQRGLRGLVQEFSALQAQQRTGPGAGVNPMNGGILFDREIRGMDALAARMRGLMRPTGSGATSDFEQRIYARGAPSIDNTPEQNAVIIEGINRATQIADQRQFFYEDYAQAYGTLNGAERAFQQSPEFRQLTEGYEAPPTNQEGQTQQQRTQRIRIDANGNPVVR